MIIEETYQFLKSHYQSNLETLTIEAVRVGLYLTAVKLSDGSFGVASTVEDEPKVCSKAERYFEEFSPGKISGRKISNLFEISKRTGLIRSLRIAAMNAISSSMLSEKQYKVISDMDPIDLIDLNKQLNITMVGAFQSYIQKIAESGNNLVVLEMNEASLSAEQKRFYLPSGDYPRVIPSSDIIIITGLTLVNDTIDGLLSVIPPHAKVIVTGPSSSLVPDVLFRHGVDIIGATKVTDGEKLFSLTGEGGAGYHLFEYCASKICIVNDSQA